MVRRRKFAIGDWVEVRSKEEIVRTLDAKGQLEGMPFMPEMLQFCGKRFRVYKSAHKTCDPDLRSRHIERAVHLETRCDGQAHGGCQAGCLLYWKEDWLKPLASGSAPTALHQIGSLSEAMKDASRTGYTESELWAATQSTDASGIPAYVCQVTQVPHAGKLLQWWNIHQYLEDYLSGNVSLWRMISGFVYWCYFGLSEAGIGVGRPMRWLYAKAYRLWGGVPWPRKTGSIPEGTSTPTAALNLQPGELVRVKSHDEILKTVSVNSRNRGLWWDAELVPYCGKTYRVLSRVSRVIDEKTGKMQEMKTPCIVLESAICQARYSACRMFCPKSTYAYWREIWLERVDPAPSDEKAQRSAVGCGSVSA